MAEEELNKEMEEMKEMVEEINQEIEEKEEPQPELSNPMALDEQIPINDPVNNQPESESMTCKLNGSVNDRDQKSHSDVQLQSLFQSQLYSYLEKNIKKQIPRSSKKSQKKVIEALYTDYEK